METVERRILEAARQLFLARGLRGTSMEAIAGQARVAKPTLYARFPNKDAVYAALVGELIAEKDRHFAVALAEAGPVTARITRALAAKYRVLAAALEGSPHAEELLGAQDVARSLFAESEARVEAGLTAALAAEGIGDAGRLARLICDSIHGVMLRRGTPAEADIALVVERLVGPDLGAPRP